MKKIYYLFILLAFAACNSGTKPAKTQAEVKSEAEPVKRPNILFIAVDDLRPELGCYGSNMVKSPNIDALASEGLLFNRAYCQEPICGPSRASIMTGARPETIGVIENYANFRDLNPDIVTLPQHFIANGYEAIYCGKIFHGNKTDEANSWSKKPAYEKVKAKKPQLPGGYALPENQAQFKANFKDMLAKYGEQAKQGLSHGPAYEAADVPDNTYGDGYNTDLAIATLKDHLATSNKPLFLGLGFKKPHLSWICPKKYWDLYDRDNLPLSDQLTGPENGAEMGRHASFELRVRHGIPKTGDIDPELSKTLRHAYLACVSYVDAQIGRMIAQLDSAGVRDNTIIVLWGDHGWHLGDMGIWGKATNYEIATRVPLMISVPDKLKSSWGEKTNALVELVDIYPTLCDLTGIPKPDHLEGQSFMSLVQDPKKPWKQAAFSQYPNPALREWAANPLSKGMRETFFGPLIKEVEDRIIAQQKENWDRDLFENHLMGYSMRTEHHRLIVWKDTRKPNAKPVFVELFDHDTDPTETKNIADQQPELVAQLLTQFDKGWKGNLAQN